MADRLPIPNSTAAVIAAEVSFRGFAFFSAGTLEVTLMPMKRGVERAIDKAIGGTSSSDLAFTPCFRPLRLDCCQQSSDRAAMPAKFAERSRRYDRREAI
jgi:hypothetical protein